MSGRTRACDEDFHQPPGALLPVRAEAHVRDADQRPKQVGGIEILWQIAASPQLLQQNALNAQAIFPVYFGLQSASLDAPRSASSRVSGVCAYRQRGICRESMLLGSSMVSSI